MRESSSLVPPLLVTLSFQDVDHNETGTMQALSAMLHLELPHISVITKMDLLPNSENDRYYQIIYAEYEFEFVF